MQPLRDFLEIPYDQLEEMNLAAKEERLGRKDPGKIREARMKYLDRREADQGGHGLLHRPRRPAAHARLRQEVPAQVGRQPDLRRLVDPRLLAAGGVGPAPGHRLAGLLLAAVRRLRRRQGAGLRRGPGARRPPYRADMRAQLKALRRQAVRRRTRRWPTPRTRSRASSSRAATPSAATTRPAASSSSPPAATTTRCPATRCAASSTRAAEVQRAHGLRQREGPPEVAPSQFEMNYSYTEATIAADQVQLYKLLSPPGRGAAWT